MKSKIDGNSYVGEIDCSYDKLVDVFGEPSDIKFEKVNMIWMIKYKKGYISIYDWKTSEDPKTRDTWFVGSIDDDALDFILDKIR